MKWVIQMHGHGAKLQDNNTNFDPWTLSDAAATAVHGFLSASVKAVTNFWAPYRSVRDQQTDQLRVDGMIAATRPANFLLTNPKARNLALETGGQSLQRGVTNYLSDRANNRGFPLLVDTTKFKVGSNLAVTPGKVVFRSKLFELIEYTPATDVVHEVPLLIVPPMINKFYILDLAKRRSLVEQAVAKGQKVYLISWINPREDLAETNFYDFVTKGTMLAMDVINVPRVNLLGLCLGGTVATMTTALDAAMGADRVNSLALIVTMTDFPEGETGVMGALVTKKLVANVREKTRKVGYLTPEDMGDGWIGISSEGLYWDPAIKRWLLGEDAPAMDLLAWNADGTRLASLMHYEYLIACYIENLFSKGEMVIGGYKLDMGAINVPIYAVAGTADHIVPWRTSFKGISRTSGPHRFILVPRGHIGVIVAVPGPRASYLIGEGGDNGTYTDSWLETAEKVEGDSWWTDLTGWLTRNSGLLTPSWVMNADMGAAPGLYVLDSDPSTYELSDEPEHPFALAPVA